VQYNRKAWQALLNFVQDVEAQGRGVLARLDLELEGPMTGTDGNGQRVDVGALGEVFNLFGARISACLGYYIFLDTAPNATTPTIAAYKATDYVFRDRLLPWITCGWIIVFGGLHTALGLLRGQTLLRPQDVLASAKPMRELASEVLRIFLWVIGLLVLVILVGHEVGVPLYIVVYMLAFGERLWVALVTALSTAAFIHIVLVEFMHITFPTPWLWDWLGL